jgi:hypothetical protein
MIQNSSAVLIYYLRLPSNKIGNLFEVSLYTYSLALSILESRLMLRVPALCLNPLIDELFFIHIFAYNVGLR